MEKLIFLLMRKINIKRINFNLDKIGVLDSEIGFMENLGEKVIVQKMY